MCVQGRSVASHIKIDGQDDGEEDDGSEDEDQDPILDDPAERKNREGLGKGSRVYGEKSTGAWSCLIVTMRSERLVFKSLYTRWHTS